MTARPSNESSGESVSAAEHVVAEIVGRCQATVYPGVCGNWLPCSDHDVSRVDDHGVLH